MTMVPKAERCLRPEAVGSYEPLKAEKFDSGNGVIEVGLEHDHYIFNTFPLRLAFHRNKESKKYTT
ncbi:hypothetical protein J6590_069070 [Homalodisca vitripennis]|nr:hypothetical protein J6590_069070 [Homalodisca vitripennis]